MRVSLSYFWENKTKTIEAETYRTGSNWMLFRHATHVGLILSTPWSATLALNLLFSKENTLSCMFPVARLVIHYGICFIRVLTISCFLFILTLQTFDYQLRQKCSIEQVFLLGCPFIFDNAPGKLEDVEVGLGLKQWNQRMYQIIEHWDKQLY